LGLGRHLVMSTQDSIPGVQYPHQMSEDEFRTWWNSIHADDEPVVRPLPEIIYLGQESATASEAE
jgi:hypothetical protein